MTMPDKPSRSVFVPLLLVGVVGLALLATLVPVMQCGKCWNGLQADRDGSRITNIYPLACSRCDASGKVPLLNIWRREAEEGNRPVSATGDYRTFTNIKQISAHCGREGEGDTRDSAAVGRGVRFPQAARSGSSPAEAGASSFTLIHTRLPAARAARRGERVAKTRAFQGRGGQALSRDSAAKSREVRFLRNVRSGLPAPRGPGRRPGPAPRVRGEALHVSPHPPTSRARGAARLREARF